MAAKLVNEQQFVLKNHAFYPKVDPRRRLLEKLRNLKSPDPPKTSMMTFSPSANKCGRCGCCTGGMMMKKKKNTKA